MHELPQILYCHCAFAQVISHGVKQKVLDELLNSGVEFEAIPDLCAMSAQRDPRLQEIAAKPEVRIAACFPRAVRGLFTAAGCALSDKAEVINMRALSGEEAAAELLRNACP